MGHPSALKRREALTFATTWRDPENTSSVREADTEGHAGCDSTDGKCPEQTDPQTQRVDSWLSGAGKEVVLLLGCWKVLELDRGAGCTTLGMH